MTFFLQGCLPTIVHAIGVDYHTLSRGVWLPVCAMHIALVSREAVFNFFFSTIRLVPKKSVTNPIAFTNYNFSFLIQLVLLVATSMFLQEGYTASNLHVYSVSAVLPTYTHKYEALDEDI